MDFEFSTADEEFRPIYVSSSTRNFPLGGGGCSLTTSASFHSPEQSARSCPTAVACTLLAARVRRCR